MSSAPYSDVAVLRLVRTVQAYAPPYPRGQRLAVLVAVCASVAVRAHGPTICEVAALLGLKGPRVNEAVFWLRTYAWLAEVLPAVAPRCRKLAPTADGVAHVARLLARPMRKEG